MKDTIYRKISDDIHWSNTSSSKAWLNDIIWVDFCFSRNSASQIVKNIGDHFKHIDHDLNIYHVLKTPSLFLPWVSWSYYDSGSYQEISSESMNRQYLSFFTQFFAVVIPGCSRLFHGFAATPHLYVCSLKPFRILQQYGGRHLLLY